MVRALDSVAVELLTETFSEQFRRGELTPPPPDVRIEGLEVLKPGTQEYEDKYGERGRERPHGEAIALSNLRSTV